jgi:hypothetical protein
VRRLIAGFGLLAACAAQDPPVQDPLDYLQVGVEPKVEAEAILDDLRRSGFRIGRRFDQPGYVAFDAFRGAEAIVRVVSARGVVLSLQAPDVRWPERLSVALAPPPAPDYDGDGRLDVVVSIRERDRTCLAWAQVDGQGFVGEVFRPKLAWGEAPCLLSIDAPARQASLEVGVPGAADRGARVRVPVRATPQGWRIDDSSGVTARWDEEVGMRERALATAEARGDSATAARLRAELDWLGRLRRDQAPVLEPPNDGEEAR